MAVAAVRASAREFLRHGGGDDGFFNVEGERGKEENLA